MAGPSTPGDGYSVLADMTPDARFVLFWSMAANLVSDDTNDRPDLFRWSRDSGEIVRVNLSDSDQQFITTTGAGIAEGAAISDDGDRVVFTSDSDGVVADDTNGHADIFLRTISVGTTTLVSLTDGGAQIATAASVAPDISGDGQRILFHSEATDAAPNDIAGQDVFVRDLAAGTTTCESHDVGGTGIPGIAYSGRISGDGTTVAFVWNSVAIDESEVYVRTRTGPIRRVTVSTANGLANGSSSVPMLSHDGLEVSFHSSATNLVPTDGNLQPDAFVAVITPSGGG
jgi:Tol biopolymer transport system component